MSFASLISLEKAMKFGAQYWDLVLNNFGGVSIPTFTLYGNDKQSPAITTEPLPPFRAAMIAPYSSIDRCELALSLPDGTGSGVSTGLIPDILSAGAPLLVDGRPLFVRASQGALYGNSYIAIDHTTKTFAVSGNTWSVPQLAIRFFFRDVPAPVGRAPLYSRVGPVWDADQSITTEQVVAVFPVFGRRKISIAVQNSGASDAGTDIGVWCSGLFSMSNVQTVYAGLFEHLLLPTSVTNSTPNPMLLSPGDTTVLGLSLNGQEAALAFDICEPQCSFIMLKAKLTDSVAGAVSLNFQITAYD